MRRIRFLIWKELIELGQDPRLFGIVIMAPILQLFLLAYAAVLPWFGFAISTFFAMFALSRFDPRTSWRDSLWIAGIGAAGFWLLFVRLLGVNFPRASLFA